MKIILIFYSSFFICHSVNGQENFFKELYSIKKKFDKNYDFNRFVFEVDKFNTSNQERLIHTIEAVKKQSLVYKCIFNNDGCIESIVHCGLLFGDTLIFNFSYRHKKLKRLVIAFDEVNFYIDFKYSYGKLTNVRANSDIITGLNHDIKITYKKNCSKYFHINKAPPLDSLNFVWDTTIYTITEYQIENLKKYIVKVNKNIIEEKYYINDELFQKRNYFDENSITINIYRRDITLLDGITNIEESYLSKNHYSFEKRNLRTVIDTSKKTGYFFDNIIEGRIESLVKQNQLYLRSITRYNKNLLPEMKFENLDEKCMNYSQANWDYILKNKDKLEVTEYNYTYK